MCEDRIAAKHYRGACMSLWRPIAILWHYRSHWLSGCVWTVPQAVVEGCGANRLATERISLCAARYFFFTYGHSTRFRVMATPYRASRSHSDTPHSVGLLWTSDKPDAETSTWQHTTDIHAPGGIRTRNPSKRGVSDRAFTGIGVLPDVEQTLVP